MDQYGLSGYIHGQATPCSAVCSPPGRRPQHLPPRRCRPPRDPRHLRRARRAPASAERCWPGASTVGRIGAVLGQRCCYRRRRRVPALLVRGRHLEHNRDRWEAGASAAQVDPCRARAGSLSSSPRASSLCVGVLEPLGSARLGKAPSVARAPPARAARLRSVRAVRAPPACAATTLTRARVARAPPTGTAPALAAARATSMCHARDTAARRPPHLRCLPHSTAAPPAPRPPAPHMSRRCAARALHAAQVPPAHRPCADRALAARLPRAVARAWPERCPKPGVHRVYRTEVRRRLGSSGLAPGSAPLRPPSLHSSVRPPWPAPTSAYPPRRANLGLPTSLCALGRSAYLDPPTSAPPARRPRTIRSPRRPVHLGLPRPAQLGATSPPTSIRSPRCRPDHLGRRPVVVVGPTSIRFLGPPGCRAESVRPRLAQSADPQRRSAAAESSCPARLSSALVAVGGARPGAARRRTPCARSDEYDVDVGALWLLGPQPLEQHRTCVAGLTCAPAMFSGRALSGANRVMALDTCGAVRPIPGFVASGLAVVVAESGARFSWGAAWRCRRV